MARTTLTAITTAAAGTTLPAAVAVDAVNGNQFVNSGREVIHITNGGGSPITATVVTNGVYSIGAVTYPIADLTVTIPAGATKVCGPFDKGLFNDGSGYAYVDYSSGTSVTANVVSLGTG